ncbi:MAG: hypothetical protein ACKV0T_01925 [Planctomycetales bacterium]
MEKKRDFWAKQREFSAKQHQKMFLQALNAEGVLPIPDISFFSDQDTSMQGKRLHEIIRNVENVTIEDWKEAKKTILETILMSSAWMVFENRWNVGSFVVAAELLRSHLDSFYRTVGPDLYCATLDLSHGFVFDKDEYSCSLRIW